MRSPNGLATKTSPTCSDGPDKRIAYYLLCGQRPRRSRRTNGHTVCLQCALSRAGIDFRLNPEVLLPSRGCISQSLLPTQRTNDCGYRNAARVLQAEHCSSIIRREKPYVGRLFPEARTPIEYVVFCEMTHQTIGYNSDLWVRIGNTTRHVS
jgi:hypothetical protein